MASSDPVIVDWRETELYRMLRYQDHGILLIVGTGQWGKTVLANSLACLPPFNQRNVVLLNYPRQLVSKGLYPSRWRAEDWPDDLQDLAGRLHPRRDYVIVDDAVWLAGARDHATNHNRDLQKFLTISSHNQLWIIVTIQNTSMLDISLMQSQDCYILHKHMDPQALHYERDENRLNQVIANAEIMHYAAAYPDIPLKSWTWCSTTCEMLSVGLPDWWRPELSRPFAGVIPA